MRRGRGRGKLCYARRRRNAPCSLGSMPAKIVHVNTARGYRGGERQTELLIRELASRGIEQALVARRGGPLAARVRGLGIDVREVGSNLFAIARAARDATLIHVHEGRGVYAAYLRSRVAGTPYIVTRRVDNPIGDHWLAHRAYRRAARVVAVAPGVADVVRAYDPAISLDVVHSASSALPVDPATSAAIRERFRGKFVVGHVGALDNAQKGQEYIIAVARELERSHPDVHFVLVGGGEDEA